MKKLLLASSLIIFTAIGISSSNTFRVNKLQTNTNFKLEEFKNKLSENPHIRTILNTVFKNQEAEKQNYILSQENRFVNAFTDFKYALTSYPLFISNTIDDEVNTQYREVMKKAKETIKNNLHLHWYW
ncbi:Uncharacterised protein, partial [Mycoplasma putrefaciens]